MTIVFSDLHLREPSEKVCFDVLEAIAKLAVEDDKRVVFCGDWWHLRYQVSVRLLNRVTAVLAHWEQLGIHVDLLPGNHDQVNVLGANALEVFEVFDNVTVWSEAGLRTDEGWGFVPYRKDPVEQLELLKAVIGENPDVVFGHFGLRGAQMNSGRKDQEGLAVDPSWPMLVLGHYHKAQGDQNWRYVGSPYQTDFGEAGNWSGCTRFDGKEFTWVPLEVGAPKHYVVPWDVAQSEQPPSCPDGVDLAVDRVRLDIKAPPEAIVKGSFRQLIKEQGLSEAQVNVIPVAPEREVKLSLGRGESLLDAVGRFAMERLGSSSADDPMEMLRSWAKDG